MRTLLLGFDGMSYRMMHDLPMPYLRGLERAAISCGLLRSFPDIESGVPHTGPCWTSIYTGLLPHEHGFTYKGWVYGENYFDSIRHKTIFDVTGSAISLTMPITFPATAVPENVLTIAGFPSVPGSGALVNDDRLREYTGRFLHDIMDDEKYAHAPEACDYQAEEEGRLRICDLLIKDFTPDNIFVGLTFLDRLNHHNAQASAITRDAYAFLDGLIYEYVNLIKPAALILCGDHGFLPSAFMPTNHDDEGYYLFTEFAAPTGCTDTSERDLTHIARLFSATQDCGADWIGQHIDRSEYEPTAQDKELIMSRLRALGYA